MPYNSKAFGLVVSRIRLKKGISQETLSAMAQIARSHLTALENGQKVVRLDTFCRIADALDIKPSALMLMTEEETEKHL